MTSRESRTHVDLGILLTRKRLKGYISDRRFEVYYNICKGFGEHKRSCVIRDYKSHSLLPHLLLAKLMFLEEEATHWSDVKPQAAFHFSCPGMPLGEVLLGSIPRPLQYLQLLSPIGTTAICYVYCFSFFCKITI